MSGHAHIAIVGAGFSGIGMAIRLKQAGIEDFVVLERAEELGGTWRDNTYPGCQCDIPSALYSFSFAPNPDWSRFYPLQEEIRDYLRRCADDFGVMPYIRFGTRGDRRRRGTRTRALLAARDLAGPADAPTC